MFSLVMTLIIIVAVLLVLIILAQNPKGSGLSSQFGGSGASQVMGVKKTSDILERLTWGFAIALVILSLSTRFFIGGEGEEGFTSPNVERAQERTVLPDAQQLQPQGTQEEQSKEDIPELSDEDTAN